MIITFANHKGGVGKTTLALITAETLLDNGAQVKIYDLDGQQNLTDSIQMWLPTAPTTEGKIEIKTSLPSNVKNEHGVYTIIDTPPGLGAGAEAAIKIADVVIVPVETRISSIKGFYDIINLKAKPRIILVLNKYDKNSAFAKEFLKEIEKITQQHDRVKLCVINRSRQQLAVNIDNGLYWAYRMTDNTAAPYMEMIEAAVKEEK